MTMMLIDELAAQMSAQEWLECFEIDVHGKVFRAAAHYMKAI